jgi:hypothetical protein
MLHRFDFQCNNFDEDQHLLMKLRGVCYYSDGEDSEDAGDVGGSGEDGQGTSNSDSDSFSSMSDRDDAEDVAGFGEDPGLDDPGEERGFFGSLFDAAWNTITDPVGIASLALGAPGWAAYAFSKGLGALGVDVPSIAHMAGLTPDSTGLMGIAEDYAKKAAADLGITAALSGISTDLGFDTAKDAVTEAIDSFQKGIASLGVGDPAQPAIGTTGSASNLGSTGSYAGNLGSTGYADGPGIASLSGAPMDLSSFAPGTGPAMADTTNPNGVDPSWSPVNFQQYSGMADTTNPNGVAPSWSPVGFQPYSGMADETNLNDVTPLWSPANFQQYSGIGSLRNV